MKFNSRRSAVMARNGMVSTSQPLATISGVRSLLSGGNAIDAAITAAAVLNVVEPYSTGIGGDMFALVWSEKDKKLYALNASGRSPASSDATQLRNMNLSAIPDDSVFSITVPGVVSGWETILERFGQKDLRAALAPAIGYAEEGYPVSEVIARHWSNCASRLLKLPSGSELLVEGRAPSPGEIVRLPELAKSLQIIADSGSGEFYRGSLAEKITTFVQERGGWLSKDDLADHKSDWVEPINTNYRGYDIWQCPPNNQGINVLMGLNIIEGFDIAGMGFQTVETYHHLIESVRLALTDGMFHITDPKHMNASVSRLLSKDYAAEKRNLIREKTAIDKVPVGMPIPKGDTVYVTVVDGDGNACSLINSVYSDFGSGLVVPGTGIALQSRGASFSLEPTHPNYLKGGKKPFHTLIPGIVTKDGELMMSYGVMGTVQQAQGQVQVLVNMLDFGLDPQEALNAPRFSYRPVESVIGVETIANSGIYEGLSKRGHSIDVFDPDPLYFGGGQIIVKDQVGGVLIAGSEPRNDGFAMGF